MMQKEIVWAGLNGELDLDEMYIVDCDIELEEDDYFSCDFVLSVINKVIDKKMDLKYFNAWINLMNKCIEDQYNEVHKELMRIISWGLSYFKIGEYDKEKLEKVKEYFIRFAGIFTNSLIVNRPDNYKNLNVISTQDSQDTGRALKSFMIIKKK